MVQGRDSDLSGKRVNQDLRQVGEPYFEAVGPMKQGYEAELGWRIGLPPSMTSPYVPK